MYTYYIRSVFRFREVMLGSPDGTARFLTVAGLVVLVVGSIYVALGVMGVGSDPALRGDYVEGAGLAYFVVWPIILLVSSLCLAIAMYRMRGLIAAIFVVVGAFAVFKLMQPVLSAISALNGNTPPSGELTLFSVLVALVFLAVDSGALYVAWRYILQG